MYKKCEGILKELENEGKLKVWYNFKFPEKEELKLRLKDMLEDEVDEKYYLSDKQINRIHTTTYNVGKTRIQEKEYCDTLCARDWKDPKCVQVGKLDIKGHDSIKRVYSDEGLSPTLTDMQGGNRQPKIITHSSYVNKKYEEFINEKGYVPELFNPYNKTEIKHIAPTLTAQGDSITKRDTVQKQMIPTLTSYQDKGVVVRKDIKEIEKYCEYCGKQLERKRFNDRLEDFTVFKNRKYCNRECMKRAYLKIGENEQSYSNAHTTARKINELILHKEVCELCGSDKNLDIHHIDGNWKNNNFNNLMCLCRSCHTKYERNKGEIGGDESMNDRLRIRKLTPKECWRL